MFGGKSLNVAIIVNIFPKISETFILNQIVELVKSGIDIEIFTRSKSDESNHHDDVIKYDLLKKTHIICLPKNWLVAIRKMIISFLKILFNNPLYFRYLINFIRINNGKLTFTSLIPSVFSRADSIFLTQAAHVMPSTG